MSGTKCHPTSSVVMHRPPLHCLSCKETFMNNFRATALLFSLTCLFTAASYAQAPSQTQNGILVDKDGMTVYTLDKDKANSGKSACNDQCAKAWQPVMADAKSKDERSEERTSELQSLMC